MKDMHRLAVAIDHTGGFEHLPEVILSAGGSAYFDFVADEFTRVKLTVPFVRYCAADAI